MNILCLGASQKDMQLVNTRKEGFERFVLPVIRLLADCKKRVILNMPNEC